MLFLKDKTGGSRPARGYKLANAGAQEKNLIVGSSRTAGRLTFVHAATKVSKNAFAPCGGHLLCRISEKSNNDGA